MGKTSVKEKPQLSYSSYCIMLIKGKHNSLSVKKKHPKQSYSNCFMFTIMVKTEPFKRNYKERVLQKGDLLSL